MPCVREGHATDHTPERFGDPPMTTTKPSPLDVDALLAYHRTQFGDARMEADTDDTGSDNEPAEKRQDDTDDRSDGDDRDGDRLGDAGKRALEAERRAKRAAEREARDAAARSAELEAQIAEYKRAEMDDQERLAAERDDWRKKYEEQAAQLAARELDLLRRDVAAEKGLPAGMARRLSGTTREELEEDADDLAALVAKPTDVPPAARVPKPDPSQGATGSGSRASTVTAAMERYMASRGTATPTT